MEIVYFSRTVRLEEAKEYGDDCYRVTVKIGKDWPSALLSKDEIIGFITDKFNEQENHIREVNNNIKNQRLRERMGNFKMDRSDIEKIKELLNI